ncbi:MAG: rod shape-determining protein MreC [candidate division Zixibacteria bacterium]|nr:rod shape-determining protein MreC [candidate division Zixibacteria bacterium]
MNWVSNLFSRYLRNLHFITIAALCTTLILNLGGVNATVTKVPMSILYFPFFKVKVAVLELHEVAKDNSSLRQSLVEASIRLSMMEESNRENDRLKRILGFEAPSGYRILPAKVISTTGGRLPNSAVINRGTKDGVAIDLPVINEEGLVGRISSVGPDVATVQLLTDPVNRVAVRVADTREMGIVKYDRSDNLMLDNYSVQSPLSEGDLIISSGLGGIFPPGLAVGRVLNIDRPENEMFARIVLKPAVNFNRLEELFVLRPQL